MMKAPLTRRSFGITTAAVLTSIAAVRAPAKPAQFTYKYANVQQDTIPLNTRTRQMWDAVRTETGGRLDVQMFTHGLLGSDTAEFTQLRVGAIQFMSLAGGLLGETVPAAGIEATPFAFSSPTAPFPAFDGELGAYIRKEIIAKGIYAFPRVWDGGVRVITTSTKPIRTAEDIAQLKIRTPEGRIWVDLFKTLGASPAPVSIPQVYSALQTHVVDGYEGSMPAILDAKYFEVQKYLCLTNHMWFGNWLLMNMDAWKALPPDIQAVVERNTAKYAMLQRRQNIALTGTLALKLQNAGLAVNAVDRKSFTDRLGPAFYDRWRDVFGTTAWQLLNRYVGKLG